MNAWPEAVWIVKKLQQNFDFTDTVDYFTRNLNTVNNRINDLNLQIANTTNELEARVVTFASTINRNTKIPTSLPSSYGNGTICLVLKQ